MIRFALLATVFASLAMAEEKPATDLDGTYELKEFVVNGQPSDERKAIQSVVIAKGTITVRSKDREDVAKFTLDSAKAPFRIDMLPTTGETKATPGIWKVEKGELTIVFSKEGMRPADFKSTGEGIVKFVLAKSKTPEKDK